MPESLRLWSHRASTPSGELCVLTDDENRLRVVEWLDHEDRMLRLLRRQYGERDYVILPGDNMVHPMQALQAYLAGDLHAIDDMLVETGAGPFSAPYGAPCVISRAAKQPPTVNWRSALAGPPLFGRLAWLTAPTRSASSCLVIA